MSDGPTRARAAERSAAVLLDFQAVMAQFLDVQTEVLGALARRCPARRAAPATLSRIDPTSLVARDSGRVADASPSHPASTAAAMPLAEATMQAAPAGQSAAVRIAKTAETRPGAPAPTDARAEASFSRYTLAVRPRPLPAARGAIAGDHAIVITEDDRGVARAVAEELRRSGRRVALVRLSAAGPRQDDLFASAVGSPEEAAALAREITAACGPVAALLHLAPLSPSPDFDTLDVTSWTDRLSLETRTLFLLAQAFGASLEDATRVGGAALVAATAMGGEF